VFSWFLAETSYRLCNIAGSEPRIPAANLLKSITEHIGCLSLPWIGASGRMGLRDLVRLSSHEDCIDPLEKCRQAIILVREAPVVLSVWAFYKSIEANRHAKNNLSHHRFKFFTHSHIAIKPRCE